MIIAHTVNRRQLLSSKYINFVEPELETEAAECYTPSAYRTTPISRHKVAGQHNHEKRQHYLLER